MDGVIVVNKPKGITSHDVVRRVRRIADQRDVGHLGTLDPMATGVLPLVIGRMTRIAQFYDRAEKTYEGVICLGLATDTYDAEGKATTEPANVNASREELEAALEQFRGEINQTPPPFSAKKIEGVPAYKLARKNEIVELKSVRVTVHSFDIIKCETVKPSVEVERLAGRELSHLQMGLLTFRAEVSSGTYIRSLAHDLGKRLGTGAHLQSLCRTRSAHFTLAASCTLEEIEAKASTNEMEKCFVPPRTLLPGMPAVTATDEQMAKLRHGNAVNLSEFSQSELVKVFIGQGQLVAIARRIAGTLFQPKVVLCG